MVGNKSEGLLQACISSTVINAMLTSFKCSFNCCKFSFDKTKFSSALSPAISGNLVLVLSISSSSHNLKMVWRTHSNWILACAYTRYTTYHKICYGRQIYCTGVLVLNRGEQRPLSKAKIQSGSLYCMHEHGL